MTALRPLLVQLKRSIDPCDGDPKRYMILRTDFDPIWDGLVALCPPDNSQQSVAESSNQQCAVVCDCAAIPPTMPTYRKHHLPTCPVWVVENAGNVQQRVTEPITLRAGETNRAKVLRGEVVKVSDGRLREMQEQAIRFEGIGGGTYHWHWAAVVNELIARRAADETSA